MLFVPPLAFPNRTFHCHKLATLSGLEQKMGSYTLLSPEVGVRQDLSPCHLDWLPSEAIPPSSPKVAP